MRCGDIYYEDMVSKAGSAGAATVIVYTDAKGAKRKWFPDARWLPPTGVQVGTLYYGNGDPTTPMWPSCAAGDDCERLSAEDLSGSEAMPGIPALPVSARDGETILKAMGGDVAPPKWQGGEDAPVYRLGPGPAVLNLTYIVSGSVEPSATIICRVLSSELECEFIEYLSTIFRETKP